MGLEDEGDVGGEDESDVGQEVDSLLDDRQNLLRWAGDLPAARRETLLWAQHLGQNTALAHQRLGEIDYLLKNYAAAAQHFGDAAVRWRALSSNDLAVNEVQLGQGAALLRAGRGDEAVAVLRPLVLAGAEGFREMRDREFSEESEYSEDFAAVARDFAAVSYYAAALLGDHELAMSNHRAATEDFTTALFWDSNLTGMVHLDAVRNSAAIAALGTRDFSRAISLSRAALAADPHSPVYLLTSAEVAHQSGDAGHAMRQNRAALENDPSSFPAANNLGVLLARAGRLREASDVLRGAVQAKNTYSLGWYNLGIVEGRRGPLHVLPSQGALARAISLDPRLGDRPPKALMDTATYRTYLDVSKPLPEGWSFAGSQQRAPVVTVGLLAVALAGVGLVSLRDATPSRAAKGWLEGVGSRLGRLRGLRKFRRPLWAIVATVASFLLAFWREPMWPWSGATYAVGLVALVGAGMMARVVAARGRTPGGVVQGSWPPGVLVGLVSGAIGSPIAPLPVIRAPLKDTRVAMAAPLALALLSLALLFEAALLHTPLMTSLCVAAFIMAGSLLLPVEPLDGSRAGRAGVLGAAGLLGAVLLLGLGLV